MFKKSLLSVTYFTSERFLEVSTVSTGKFSAVVLSIINREPDLIALWEMRANQSLQRKFYL